MDNKPETLRQIYTEPQLAKILNLPLTKHKKSLVLSYWIHAGLRCMKIKNKRYFAEQDILNWLWFHRNTDKI